MAFILNQYFHSHRPVPNAIVDVCTAYPWFFAGYLVKDYKEYSEIYTPIEIELTPNMGELCNIIHYPKETEESQHYHIHFIYSSGNKKESNKFYLSKFKQLN